MSRTIRVTVWNEGRHEKTSPAVKKVYPKGIHGAIAAGLKKHEGFTVRTATLDADQEHGLSEKVLKKTDVLTWWGHMAHGDVRDEIVDRVQRHVLEGMGLIVLHSGHYSKPFRRLMGTGCGLKWREAAEQERLWVVNPGHPIVAGLGEYIELEHTEMYGELFDIPQPDDLIFISWFEGGDVFRSGCCWNRGKGKVFYFRPGHETFPIFYKPEILQVLANACRWAARPVGSPYSLAAPNVPVPLNPIPPKE
ncbi:MAG TPA: ThuA domain-containing protein [Phycisphaerae bacterium]|nr:ThuA domain-containing protein [Phycisphaerae bacterium]